MIISDNNQHQLILKVWPILYIKFKPQGYQRETNLRVDQKSIGVHKSLRNLGALTNLDYQREYKDFIMIMPFLPPIFIIYKIKAKKIVFPMSTKMPSKN